jgi:hypothetical protein
MIREQQMGEIVAPVQRPVTLRSGTVASSFADDSGNFCGT